MNPLRYLIRGVLHAAGQDGSEGGGGGSGGDLSGSDNAGGDGSAADGADNNQQALAAVETRAREMGWAPKEEWRGNPAHWMDADEFVQRSEQMIPILRSNLRKTESEVERLRRVTQEQDQKLKAAMESIDVLTNISTEQSRNAAKERRRELLRQRATARRDGDTDTEIALEEQIEEVTTQINSMDVTEQLTATTPKGKGKGNGAAKTTTTPPVTEDADPTQDPEYIAWTKDNTWFGTDARRTALATAIGQEIRSNPANAGLVGRAFFDLVTAEMNKFLGGQQRPGGSKVESGGGGGGGRSDQTRTANGKSYSDLPQDAKEACQRQAKLVVGEGRAFKDMAAWQKHYTSMYFNS